MSNEIVIAPDTTQERTLAKLVGWMKHSHVSAQAPDDWAASGECARLLAATLLRYATALSGDLAHQEVRDDLRCLRAVVDLALDAGDEQAAAVKKKAKARTIKASTGPAYHRNLKRQQRERATA